MANQSSPTRIVVACSADDRYAAPMTVMLKSIERHLRPGVELDVYVLGIGISRSSREKVAASLDPARVYLHWIRVPRAVRAFPVFGHVSSATYSRLLIPDLLPPGVTKVIYLDSDIIVLGDLAELWEIDMHGAPLLAAQDGELRLAGASGVAVAELGLPPDAKYLNAGVLVMDVARWRTEGTHRRIMDYLRRYRARVEFWDQDGINAILATRWGELGREWNVRVYPQFAVPDRTAAEVIAGLVAGTKIIHFASSVKPWEQGAVHPAIVFFSDALALTAWQGWQWKPPRRRQRPWNRHNYGQLLRKVPVLGPLWAKLRSSPCRRG